MMTQDSEYVGVLPASIDVSGIEFIEDTNIGSFVRVPIDTKSPNDDRGDIGKVALYLAQFTSKHVEGDIRVNDYSVNNDNGVLSASYRVEQHQGSMSAMSGQTLYVVCPITIKIRGEHHKFVSLHSDPDFTKGHEILKAFVEEAKAKLKPA
ncbi:hypothetical protein HYV80_02080 [Candidatus Woesearchaeota archaeon]|nr:hypothetical protein [Candidatus Woesearchaeota archaeon]